MAVDEGQSAAPDLEIGLRGRQRVRRREEIIDAARTLFVQKGVDATTMADIAAVAGVSPPTVFNHFGSKDGVLIALIVEGTEAARRGHDWAEPPEGTDLVERVFQLLAQVSAGTLDIAGKRVWRYAEAAAIRHPDTDFAMAHNGVSQELVAVFSAFFGTLDLRDRRGERCDAAFLGPLFHDMWNPLFIELITDAGMTIEQHRQKLRARVSMLVRLIFDDASIAAPKRRKVPQ